MEYNGNSIQILEELEAVRQRPGMYIGSTDSRGLHHLVWEIVDNAIDEVLAEYANKIDVTINEDNSIVVIDNGRGIPIDIHKSGIPTVQVVYTKLHAGGKFNSSNGYKISGGLHGVGASVVNALCEFVDVKIYRNGKIYHQRYEDGGKVIGPYEVIGKTKKTGTEVYFKPDSKNFSTTLFDFNIIKERLVQSAYLLKGLTITLRDKRDNIFETYHFENGISQFVSDYDNGKDVLHEPFYFEGTSQDIEVDCAMQFNKSYSDNLLSFVNNVRTKDGGTHETGFKSALTKVFNEHARKLGLLKEKDNNLEGVDIREGLTSVISVRIPEKYLQFEGQTKSKLGTPEARSAVETVVSDNLRIILEENNALATKIISKIINAQRVRLAARKARDDARLNKKRSKKDTNLSGKLSPAISKDPNIKELFLVEGDSAGGSAKQGRDRYFQAILPLRGKVINCEKANINEVLKNTEINTIINTIDAGFGNDFVLENAKYSKVIIMTDADDDGAHIQVLLLTFFFRFMPELIMAGRVYIALPPLYKINFKRGKTKTVYAYSDEELNSLTSNKQYSIQRFKGLGEMNSDQLWETTMNPNTRTLIQVKIEDLSDAESRISVLMGDKVEPRREWLENNVSFANEDNFVISGDK